MALVSRRFIDYAVPLFASMFLSLLTLIVPLFGVFWFPGFILAGIAFPDGIHSDQAGSFFVAAAVINFFVYFLLFRLITAIIMHRSDEHRMIHH